MNQKFILTVRELHLGHIKETFGAGAVIEYDEVNNRLIVDGRKFDDTRDLDVLKRQAVKFPEKPWIIPFSEEALAQIRGQKPTRAEAAKKPRPGENMPVIKSDEDLVEPIDIKNTQISKKTQQAKEAARQKVKSEKMEIIRGDETVEERLARLKDKTDVSSVGERVRIKASMPAKMPIVHDDSLGQGVSRSQIPLNAGQILPSREDADAKAENAKAIADARKKEAEMRRKELGVEETPALVSESIPVSAGAETVVGVEIGDNDLDVEKDAEISKLKARIAELEARNVAPKKVVRTPVTDVSEVQQGV